MKRKLIALILVIGISVSSFGTDVLFPTEGLAALAAGPVIEPLVAMPADEAAILKWRQEAQEFDVAIGEIEGILRLDLKTEAGSEQADRILERNEKKLPFAKAKIASGALKFPAFRKAVELEAQRRGGDERFAEEFKRDASIAKGISGLHEVARQMEAEIQPAITVLKKVGAAFAQAAKNQSGKTSPMQFDSPAGKYSLAKAAYTSTVYSIQPAAISISAPANFCQALGISVSKTICNIIAGVIFVYVGHLAGNLSCINSCIDQKISQRATCQRNARDQAWPFNIMALSRCKEQFLGGVAGCILGCD